MIQIITILILVKLKWGTEGYNQQDLGDGRYNILDQSGNNLGIGYKKFR